MPPDPILGLLAFVGLCVYSVIGGAVGATALRIISPKVYHKHLAGVKKYGYSGEVHLTFWPFVILWPAAVALLAPAAILMGPAWISRKVGVWTAKAQIKEAT